jgi:hypothetical protein
VWVTARHPDSGQVGRYAVYQVGGGGEAGVEAWFDDPAWDDVEAVGVVRRGTPMGRLSTVKPEESTGMLLCLDANHSALEDPDGNVPRAERIRILIAGEENETNPLGVVPILEDGSFLVEVPVDRAIGFEALDEEGRVLRRLLPTLWLRPGENRACVGCHEPRNTAPENRRPLAVKERMVPLSVLMESVSQPGVEP